MSRGLWELLGASRFALQSSNLKNAETCILDDTRDAIQKQEASRCLDGFKTKGFDSAQDFKMFHILTAIKNRGFLRIHLPEFLTYSRLQDALPLYRHLDSAQNQGF